MPIDIQVLINDGEIGLAMLRIIEIIGEDELKNLGSETLYFLVNALNQMNIDLIEMKSFLQSYQLEYNFCYDKKKNHTGSR